MGKAYEAFCKLGQGPQDMIASFIMFSLDKEHDKKYDRIFDNLTEYSKCKSPIETLFNVAYDLVLVHKGFNFDLERQYDVITENGHHYIMDFAYVSKKIKVAIECDGHEFHERTKEQVEYRNNRDYDLMTSGFDVLHFSGSEIYANPVECASKVINFIKRKADGDI